MGDEKMVKLDDILEVIDMCRSVIIAKQETANFEITRDKAESYILDQTKKIQELGNILTGIDIVETSIKRIYGGQV